MYKIAVVVCLALAPAAVSATTPRDVLAQAVLNGRDKNNVLQQVTGVEATAAAALAKNPQDGDALLTQAMAMGYRAKLSRNRRDAINARTAFERIVARNPRDAEAQAALGSWHVGAVAALGGLVARGALGARRAVGLDALDKSVALGGDRALFRCLAALLRLELDPADARGAALVQAAARGSTPTPLDKAMQHRAAEMLSTIKAGNARTIQETAKRLLPLGQLGL